jgi:hypothetical protein
MYALKWRDSALKQLADIYVAARVEDRERMAGAVEKLNARFKSAPLDEGESRSGAGRITFVAGLAILFYVDVATRTVYVTRVVPYGR